MLPLTDTVMDIGLLPTQCYCVIHTQTYISAAYLTDTVMDTGLPPPLLTPPTHTPVLFPLEGHALSLPLSIP